MRRARGRAALVALLPGFVFLAAAAPAKPAAPEPALRAALVARINVERRAAGVRPFALHAVLNRVAQARAEEIARRGELPQEKESFVVVSERERRIRQAGYLPHGWAESFTATAGDVEAVVRYWQEGASFRAALAADYHDAGIGVATLHGVPLYVFLFAWPEQEFYDRQVAGLRDVVAVRREMLARVNAVRQDLGLPPLATDARLDAAAQEHAEDMLRRAYYSHETPEGGDLRARALVAGYVPQRIGENIAEGEFTVEEAMAGWMASSGHRKNIVDPAFSHLGVGLAVGRYEARLRILWVQDFGTP